MVNTGFRTGWSCWIDICDWSKLNDCELLVDDGNYWRRMLHIHLLNIPVEKQILQGDPLYDSMETVLRWENKRTIADDSDWAILVQWPIQRCFGFLQFHEPPATTDKAECSPSNYCWWGNPWACWRTPINRCLLILARSKLIHVGKLRMTRCMCMWLCISNTVYV